MHEREMVALLDDRISNHLPLPTPALGSGVHQTTDEAAAAAEDVVVAIAHAIKHRTAYKKNTVL